MRHDDFRPERDDARSRPTFRELWALLRGRRADRWGKARRLSIACIAGEPGGLRRALHHVEALRANGMRARLIDAGSLRERLGSLAGFDLLLIGDAPSTPEIESAVARMRALGRLVVFDGGGPAAAMRLTDICLARTEELSLPQRLSGHVAHVLPDGFDQAGHDDACRARRRRRQATDDGLIRIGHADDALGRAVERGPAGEAVARLLREHAGCRLVLFRTSEDERPAGIAGLEDRIEWRPRPAAEAIPDEIARLDVNLAPGAFGDPFRETADEAAFVAAALVEVPTVASPAGALRRAIEHGRTGFLAATADDWYGALRRLVEAPDLRRATGRAAYRAALAGFGPLQRAARLGRILTALQGGPAGATAFALDAQLAGRAHRPPAVPVSETVFAHDRLGPAEVTVAIPLYNYAHHLVEALDSVRAQTLGPLDLVVVDDRSTDDSLAVAHAWATANADRFNRLLLLRNHANSGLALCRNAAFDAADTGYIMALDADNRLRPGCCATLLETIRANGAAFAYPTIQQFGMSSGLMSAAPYDPQRLVHGPYIDAMALVSKEAWTMAGGYAQGLHGWEDYDLWCRFAELGLRGVWRRAMLADYRVHASSMMHTHTHLPEVAARLQETFMRRHPWVTLTGRHAERATLAAAAKDRQDRPARSGEHHD